MATASYEGLDVGLDGGALHPNNARSTVNVTHGDTQIAIVDFAMAGVDGVFRHDLGSRGRTITWRLDLRARTLEYLYQIEAAVETRKRTGEGVLVSTTGRVFRRVVIERYTPGQGFQVIRSGDLAGWVTRTDAIVFRQMT